MTSPDIGRRALLAAAGAAGALALGAGVGAPVLAGSRPYTNYTYAATTDAESVVQVAWYEAYNGVVQETQAAPANATRALDATTTPSYVAEPAGGPTVAIGDVLPGDAGVLAVGVLVDELPASGERLAVTVSAEGVLEAENGLNEPELAGGDDESGAELAGATEATLWLDGGLVPCDGRRGVGDTVLASGSLRDVLDALAAGIPLGSDCLGAGDTRCFGLSWSLPVGTGDAVQTDGVAFDLVVVAESCGEEPA